MILLSYKYLKKKKINIYLHKMPKISLVDLEESLDLKNPLIWTFRYPYNF
jgi:hypothetical protein